jgi:2,3-bisphosphoglycerate-independent phosphoglycerate mutase
MPRVTRIKERFGPSWGCFVEMPVERGIALILGMGEVPAPGLEDPAERYGTWARLAAEALDGYDAVYVHIKGPDIPAHDGRAEDKRDVIEIIDGSFFGDLLPAIDPGGVMMAVTADHATSCLRKAHTADPVPLVVAGGGVRSDGTETFGERSAADGAIGTIKGVEILPALIPLLKG